VGVVGDEKGTLVDEPPPGVKVKVLGVGLGVKGNSAALSAIRKGTGIRVGAKVLNRSM
jgi:hypothetical protein